MDDLPEFLTFCASPPESERMRATSGKWVSRGTGRVASGCGERGGWGRGWGDGGRRGRIRIPEERLLIFITGC